MEARSPERVVSFRPRAVLQTIGVLLGVALGLWVLYVARQTITWILVALFLTLALAPAVTALERHGLRRRGAATAVVFLLAIAVAAGLGALLIPPLVDQISGFADALPGYLHDLTKGRGPLGFLERNYHVVEKARQATSNGGAAKFAGGAG